MSRALERSLVGIARCPYCGTDVYLGEAEPQKELHDIHVDEQVDPALVMPSYWWECAHGAAERAHRWKTSGPIELRPVLGLHVHVIHQSR